MRNENTPIWPWLLGIVLIGGVAFLLLRDRVGGDAPTPAAAAAVPAREVPVVAPAVPAADATAPVQHPLQDALAADPALPALAASDDAAWQALGTLFPGQQALAPLLRDYLIARLVTQVDVLDRRSVPPTALAMRPLPGTLQVEARDGARYIAAGNAQRYAPYVAAFTDADADALARAYVRFYPLIQQAYADLGHREAYFNDRLVAVIDHLLQTPQPARPLAVVEDARGRQRFADADLQARSVGQKALLRLDLEQQRAVMQQLRALRAAITRG